MAWRTPAKFLAALILPWVVIELALRIVGYQAPDNRTRVLLFPKFPAFYEPDRDLGWRLRPNITWSAKDFVKPFATDDSGNRRTTQISSPSDIDCLGDSSTFGYGAIDARTYPAALARLSGKTVRNLGVPGYTSQSAKILAEKIDDPAPVTLVMVGFNDHFPAFRSAREELWTRRIAYACFASRLCSLLFDRLAKPASTTRPELNEFKPSVSPEEYEENLVATIRTLRARGSEPILLVYPSILSDVETRAAVAAYWKHPRHLVDANIDSHPFYQAITQQVGHEEGVRVVDLASIFDAKGNEGLHLDWVHPNEEGYELIAQSLLEPVGEALDGKPRSRD